MLYDYVKDNNASLVAFEPENVCYLTGFWGEGIAILDNNGLALIVPKLEADRARKESKGYNCTIIESERGSSMMKHLLDSIDNNVITDCNDYQLLSMLKSKVNAVYNAKIFSNARKVKDDNEISKIRRASMLIDKLFEKFEDSFEKNMSELEVQAMIMYEALRLGLQPAAYRYTLMPLIVASGKNSSLPHAEPSKRRIKDKDLVTLDLTFRYKGYVSDATRTFAIGSVTKEQKKVYEIVKESQEQGVMNAIEGIKANELDDVCRSIIREHGYDKYFIHSTGHGIGLDIHEQPLISMNSDDILSNNMAITIEPGIYLPNRYGVRIEDSIIINKNKAIVLNRYSKELIIL